MTYQRLALILLLLGAQFSCNAPASPPPQDPVVVEASEECTLPIFLTRLDTGEAVPGARVLWFSPGDLEARRVFLNSLGDPSVLDRVFEEASEFVADESGRLRVPRSDDQLLLVVVDGERRGFALVPPDREEGELEIVVGPVRNVTVEVRDEHGRPAPGGFVRLYLERDGESEYLRLVMADENGSATFHSPDLYAGSRWRGAGLYFSTYDLARQAHSDSEHFELPMLPTGPIQLNVEAGVDVALAFVDSRGHTIDPLGARLTGLTIELPELGLHTSATLVDGQLILRRLPLGALCQSPAPRGRRMAGISIPAMSFRAPAAATHGDSLFEVVTPVDFEGLTIRGRLLDADGHPQVVEPVWGTLHRVWENRPGYPSLLQALQTDAEGRFVAYVYPLPEHFLDRYGRQLSQMLEGHTSSRERFLSDNFEAHIVDGSVDLGDLVLRPARRLASGRITDDAGQALAGAGVYLHLGPGWDAELSDNVRAQVTLMFYGLHLTATTDSDGAFEISGYLPTGIGNITVQSDLHQDRTFDLAAGALDLDIVLTRLGELRLGLEAQASEGWVARLFPTGANGGKDDVRKSGSFIPHLYLAACRDEEEPAVVWRQVPQGTYRFELRHNDMDEPVLAVDGLVVEPGVRLVDPRLQGIDLQALSPELELTLLEPNGDKLTIEGAHSIERLEGMGRSYKVRGRMGLVGPNGVWQLATFDGQPPIVHLDNMPAKILIDMEGFALAEIVVAERERTIKLSPLLQLDLGLPGDVELPTGWHLGLLLGPVEGASWPGTLTPPIDQLIDSDASGRFLLESAGAGRHSLRLVGLHPIYGIGAAGVIEIPAGVEFTVIEGAAARRALPIDQDLVDSLCKVP